MADTLSTSHKQSQPTGVVEIVRAINATTATNTPVAIPCAGAKKIGVVFTEGGTVNNRSGVLAITVSMDGGTNFYAYNMLLSNVANTNEQQLTRVASITRNSAGTDLAWLTPETLGTITSLKATVTVTDGASPTGNFTVYLAISY